MDVIGLLVHFYWKGKVNFRMVWSSFGEASNEGCRTDNINVLELWPIVFAVKRCVRWWKNRIVNSVTDNTQVKAALNTGRSRNRLPMGWLRLIFF